MTCPKFGFMICGTQRPACCLLIIFHSKRFRNIWDIATSVLPQIYMVTCCSKRSRIWQIAWDRCFGLAVSRFAHCENWSIFGQSSTNFSKNHPFSRHSKSPENRTRMSFQGLTADLGFEPRQTESESVVLPLHNPAK